MASKNALSVMHGAALWAATFVSVVAVAGIGSAAYVSFTTTDYAYPRTGGTTNLNATMWNKLIDNVADIGARTSAVTSSSGSFVGIGTSAPTQSLSFGTDGSSVGMDTQDGSDNKTLYVMGGGGTGGWARGATIMLAGNENANSGSLSLEAGNVVGGKVSISAGGAERVRVTASGSVGIGTSSPVFKLDVNGSANAASQCIGGSCLSAWGGIVGGSYTTATSKCAAVNNPSTGSTSCPSGFSGVVTGRGLCDQSDPSMYVTYLCVKN